MKIYVVCVTPPPDSDDLGYIAGIKESRDEARRLVETEQAKYGSNSEAKALIYHYNLEVSISNLLGIGCEKVE